MSRARVSQQPLRVRIEDADHFLDLMKFSNFRCLVCHGKIHSRIGFVMFCRRCGHAWHRRHWRNSFDESRMERWPHDPDSGGGLAIFTVCFACRS